MLEKPKLKNKITFGDRVGLELSKGELLFVEFTWRFLEKGKEVGRVQGKFYPKLKVAFVGDLGVVNEFRSTHLDMPMGYGTSILTSLNKKLEKLGAVGVLDDGTLGGSYKNHLKIEGWYKRHNWNVWPNGPTENRLYYAGRKLSLNEYGKINALLASNYTNRRRFRLIGS